MSGEVKWERALWKNGVGLAPDLRADVAEFQNIPTPTA